MSQIRYGDVSWERMIRAVEKVRRRLLRAASALERAGIPYAVAGGNAVAATHGLYNPDMWSSSYGCKIQQSGASGSYTYSVATDRPEPECYSSRATLISNSSCLKPVDTFRTRFLEKYWNSLAKP